MDFAFRLKTLFQRGYPGETEEKPLRNKIFRQKFIEGLEIELKSKIRHRKIDQFEDLVAEANKYSIRLEVDKEERSKNEFVRAITETTIGDAKIDSILDLMNKQNESINAIQEKFKTAETNLAHFSGIAQRPQLPRYHQMAPQYYPMPNLTHRFSYPPRFGYQTAPPRFFFGSHNQHSTGSSSKLVSTQQNI